MNIKLFDSELKVMEVLWSRGRVSAKDIAKILNEEIGWKKSTTYTVINKCIEKGAIKRIDYQFNCEALIEKGDVQEYETRELIDKYYNGSALNLVAKLLDGKNKSKKEIEGIMREFE
ncbi:MAG: BlaI/MecI/CopY family transcriptional regulator [Tissierellia bacterium]|nr:BlaI/MecI/CopY family transcriptional regulator [Tissierellia bacterium]